MESISSNLLEQILVNSYLVIIILIIDLDIYCVHIFCGYSFYTFNIILLICHQRPMTFGLNKRTNIQSISVFIMINPANRNTVHEVLHSRVSAATHFTHMRNFHSKSRISKSTKNTKKVDAKAGLGVMNIISVAIMFDHHKKLNFTDFFFYFLLASLAIF